MPSCFRHSLDLLIRLLSKVMLLVFTSAVSISPVAADTTACAQTSDLAGDETIELFHTSAYFDEPSQRWRLPLHIWVYEPEDSLVRAALFAKVLEQKFNLFKTAHNAHLFEARVNLLIADNERGKRLVIRIGGRCYSLPESEPNGHIHHEIELPENISSQTSSEGIFTYQVVLSSSDSRQYRGQAQLRFNKGLFVISDIDDTVKRTDVSDTSAMLNNTFLKEFRTVSGMAQLFQTLSMSGAQFHFVSSSPWQLYSPLLAMLDSAEFPWADFSLKHVRFRDETLFNLFKEGTDTKPEQIEAIIKRYPKREFILIGDSGDQDPEVYQQMYLQHPDQIKAIWIRDVSQKDSTRAHINLLNKAIAPMTIQLFRTPDELLDSRKE